MEKLSKAIKQMNSGRASGKDAPQQKSAKQQVQEPWKFSLILSSAARIKRSCRDTLIVALYGNKGSKADCRNYRGVSLLSIAGKVCARIVLNRLIAVSEASLPCGFRPDRSTVDMICTARRVQEKCLEQNLDLLLRVHRPDQGI